MVGPFVLQLYHRRDDRMNRLYDAYYHA